MIPYGRQFVTPQDIEAVKAVLTSDFLTQGPAVPAFEGAVAKHVEVSHGVAVTSATSALHIACLALGVGPGDTVWTVPNTFVASANCARYCGASVDFVDIDPLTWNMSVSALEQKLVEACSNDTLPKVVIPVHFAGQPTDQPSIWRLAQQYGFRVIEDASHSIGATLHAAPVGSCKWSDITVFSFHPVKIITCGEGGMALTNDQTLADHMRLVRSHGVTRDPQEFVDQTGLDTWPPWYYEQITLGYNYRMTDIHAALGRSQLSQLAKNIERRNLIAKKYDEALSELPLQLPTLITGCESAYHLYVVRLPMDRMHEHRQFIEDLRSRGIGVNLHYLPVHLQPDFRQFDFKKSDFPESERHGSTAASLPMYATLTDQQQDTVIAELVRYFRG